MNLPLVIGQSRGEFLKVINTRILQALLTKLNFIIFPFISCPITFKKIKDDDILFIGCLPIPFENSEFQDIVQSVEMANFLIIISGSEYKGSIQTNFNQWCEIEAEIQAKLDIIRNNIILKLK